MKYLKYLFFIFISLSCLVSFFVFSSSRGLFKLRYSKLTDNPITSSKDFNRHFLFFPNISGSALPIDAFRASFYLFEGNNFKAKQYLKRASEVNPYIGYSDYILADFWYGQGNIDSSLFYSKKAFDLWPKSFDNFKMYNKALAYLGDTTEILNSYNKIKDFFVRRPEYYKNFIKSYSFAKYSYYISSYPDPKNVHLKQLVGNWVRGYDLKDGSVKLDTTVSLSFDSNRSLISNKKSRYTYELLNDSLYFYTTGTNKYLISKMQIKYSSQYETLIISGNPNTEIKNRYFKKIE